MRASWHGGPRRGAGAVHHRLDGDTDDRPSARADHRAATRAVSSADAGSAGSRTATAATRTAPTRPRRPSPARRARQESGSDHHDPAVRSGPPRDNSRDDTAAGRETAPRGARRRREGELRSARRQGAAGRRLVPGGGRRHGGAGRGERLGQDDAAAHRGRRPRAARGGRHPDRRSRRDAADGGDAGVAQPVPRRRRPAHRARPAALGRAAARAAGCGGRRRHRARAHGDRRRADPAAVRPGSRRLGRRRRLRGRGAVGRVLHAGPGPAVRAGTLAGAQHVVGRRAEAAGARGVAARPRRGAAARRARQLPRRARDAVARGPAAGDPPTTTPAATA